MADRNSAPIVFLVHGTWPRGLMSRFVPQRWQTPKAAWFDEGSVFREDLKTRLAGNVRFEVFEWSGQNSVAARAAAATELSERLATARRAHPGIAKVIIAHSHGGNIVSHALKTVDAAPDILGVATMGTPFLYLREREISIIERFMFRLVPASIMFLLFIGGLFILPENRRRPDLTTFVVSLVISVAGLGIVTLKIIPTLSSYVATLLKQTINYSAMPTSRSVQWLILRCRGDEAATALNLARLFVIVNRLLWRIFAGAIDLAMRAFWLAAIWVAVSTTVLVLLDVGKYLDWGADTLFWTIVAPGASLVGMVPVIAVVIVVFAVSAGILLLPFGRDLMALGYFLEVAAGSLPMGIRTRVTNVAVPYGNRSSKHSVYLFPAARAQLAMWMADVVRQSCVER